MTREDLELIRGLMKEELKPIHDRLDKIEGRLDKVEDRLDKIEDRLGKVENEIVVIKNDISEIKREATITREVVNEIGKWVEANSDKYSNPYPA